jgi:hypothetical protein
MQYRQTLPLNDHEVVITFDDGPCRPQQHHSDTPGRNALRPPIS